MKGSKETIRVGDIVRHMIGWGRSGAPHMCTTPLEVMAIDLEGHQALCRDTDGLFVGRHCWERATSLTKVEVEGRTESECFPHMHEKNYAQRKVTLAEQEVEQATPNERDST